MKEAIIAVAQVSPGLRVLDIASGTGEPAVAIAAAVGPTGHVTATDLGAGMLAVAEEEARANGLTNLTFQQADAHALPFADQSFDRVTCRFGVMYFADSPTALREIRRVLKPGGRAAFIAWGMLDGEPVHAEHALARSSRGSRRRPRRPARRRPSSLPSLARSRRNCAARASSHVEEETRTMPLPWPGPPEELWQHFRDIAAPFRPLINGLPEAEREVAIGEVLADLRHFYDGERITIPASIVVASAVR